MTTFGCLFIVTSLALLVFKGEKSPYPYANHDMDVSLSIKEVYRGIYRMTLIAPFRKLTLLLLTYQLSDRLFSWLSLLSRIPSERLDQRKTDPDGHNLNTYSSILAIHIHQVRSSLGNIYNVLGHVSSESGNYSSDSCVYISDSHCF